MVGTRGSRDHPTHEREELLATKLATPHVRPGLLARPRLLKSLDEAIDRGLTLVCTPAGFGKTTLLADWADRVKRPVAWLSLDPDDSDPVRFWRYVAAALERSGVRVGERVRSLLEAPRGVSSEGVVTALLNELEASPDEVTLVFDDYHVIESRPVHDGMTFLVSHLPPQLHVLMATRSDPPLPLPRLRARGQIAELRAADLRFTPEESAAFLREVWGLDLSPEAVVVLESRTEGWVVGLQLAALSLRDRPDPDAFVDAFTGTHRYVLDYLSGEVLERQPERVRTFLLRTSILERLSGALCDAVTGGSDGQAMLEDLERANLFLVPLDEERRWYRFHHLFRELLRARLQQTEISVVPDLHRRAAAWCERHGLIDEAVHHGLRSDDAPWAARLVEQHLAETLGRAEEAHVERWLAQLPDDAVLSRPALCLAQGLRQLFLGRLDSVERFLGQAERVFHHGQESPAFGVLTEVGTVGEVPAAIALLRSELAGARGDPEGMAEYAASALSEMAEEEHGPRFWARWLSGAEAELMRGRLAEAERASAELLAEGHAAPDPLPGMVSPLSWLGQVQQARGSLTAALRTHREALRLATLSSQARMKGPAPTTYIFTSAYQEGLAHLGIAQVLYERDLLEDALRHVEEGIELGRQETWFREHALVISAWIRDAMGQAETALEAMNEASRLQASPEVNSLWHPAASERARLLVAQGQTAEAERWTEERGLTEDDDVSYLRERDHLVLARVLLARSEPGRALRLVERVDELARSQDRIRSLIQIRAVGSLAMQATGDHQGALALLADVLALGRPEGFIRVFADEGPPMAALLQSLIRARRHGGRAAASRAEREHVNRVVRAFRSPVGHLEVPGTAPVEAGPIEPLTRRELEVLGLMAAGRRNQQIADELVVTLDTVKRHVSHIFDKLGTASRTEAIARARELRFLP
ncbi:MAG TPA: LuxR C-terminal-related transcriptional regulator [Actinomycetota bacterium]